MQSKEEEKNSKNEEVKPSKIDSIQKLQGEIDEKLIALSVDLENARKTIDELDMEDLSSLRLLPNPPQIIKLGLYFICLMFGNQNKISEKIDNDHWEESKCFMHNWNFLLKLKTFNPESISDVSLQLLTDLLEKNPEFTPENAEKISKCARILCKWIRLMVKYRQSLQPIIKLGKEIEKLEEKPQEEIANEKAKAYIDEYMPVLSAASDALNSLERSSLVEMKSYKNPPLMVKLTMKCICILLGIQIKKTAKEDESWEESKKLLSNTNFLNELKSFDKDNLKQETLSKLKKIFEENHDFTLQNIQGISKAAANLYSWVVAILKYGELLKNIEDVRNPDRPKTASKEKKIEKDNDIKGKKKEKGKPKPEIEEQKGENLVNQNMTEERKAILQQAHDAINCLNKSSITEMKSLANPPANVLLTMRFVSMLLENDIKKFNVSWKDCQKMMNNPQTFLQRILTFDVHFSEEVYQEAAKLFESNPNFNCEHVRASSKAASEFCSWVKNIFTYYEIVKKAKDSGVIKQIPEKAEIEAKPKVVKEKSEIEEQKGENLVKINQDNPEDFEIVLKKAREAIDCLNKNCVTEMKSLASPPANVLLTMKFVSMLLENDIKKFNVSWKDCQKMMNNLQLFIEKIKQFDGQISEEVYQEALKLFQSNPNFTFEVVKNSSKAASQFCAWVKNFCIYYELVKKEKDSRLIKQISEKIEKEVLLPEVMEPKEVEEKKAKIKEILNSLNRKDFEELLSFIDPPPVALLTMQFVSLIVHNDISKFNVNWNDCLQMIANPEDFLARLISIKDISSEVFLEVGKLMESNPSFEPENVQKCSNGAHWLCKWVRDIYENHEE